MFDFRTIELADQQWIENCLKESDFMGAEYSFVNNFAWQRFYEIKICRYKDFYILCYTKNGLEFNLPAGKGDYALLIKEMRKYAKENGTNLIINAVSDENLSIFEENFAGEFEVRFNEASCDYIYKVENLAKLEGKKYAKKRNHLKKIQNYNYSFEAMSEKDFDDCQAFAAELYNNDVSTDEITSKVVEQLVINTLFTNFRQLKLYGGVLRVDGKVEAFTIASRLNSNTIDVHIEKANTEILGAYPAINNEFMKLVQDEFFYANREEDLGLEGLRKSKKSYYPEMLLRKNTIVFNKLD